MKALLLAMLCIMAVSCGSDNEDSVLGDPRGAYKEVCIRQWPWNYGYLYGKYENEATLYPIYTTYNSWYRVPTVCYNW